MNTLSRVLEALASHREQKPTRLHPSFFGRDTHHTPPSSERTQPKRPALLDTLTSALTRVGITVVEFLNGDGSRGAEYLANSSGGRILATIEGNQPKELEQLPAEHRRLIRQHATAFLQGGVR